MLKHLLTAVLLAMCLINIQAQTPTPPAGVFRLGIAKGSESHWLASKEKVKGMTFQWKTLPDTRGFILEVDVRSLSDADMLFWSFGDCQPDADINVFSVEGQAFTCYYGESMKRILISDINVWNADSRYASILSAVPGACIEDVTLRNIHLYYKGGYSEEEGKRTPPEQEKIYPEPWIFGTIPAKGFYIRHAKNITFDGIRFRFEKPDGRPLFVSDDVENIEYYNTPKE